LAVASAHAGVLLNEDFSTFTAGDLVGQNGWTQLGTSATLPLQVNSGAVVITGAQTPPDNQDAIKNFTAPFAAPASGSASLFVGAQLSLSSAPTANSSYFLAVYDGVSFANIRVAAKDNGGTGFLLGARVTGQGGYPFVFGSVGLAYDTPHAIFVQAELVAGAQNDIVKVYVNPTSADLASQTPYLTETYASGTVNDPAQLTGLIISQFANATTTTVGANISKVASADNFADAFYAIPEPSSLALVAIGAVLFAVRRRRE
jgi:hypothetical protein